MTIFNPKFLVKNAIDDVSQLSDSAATDAFNRIKLIDRNSEFKYASLGVYAGTRTITWTPAVATTINRIIVSNCNWSSFTIKYNTSSNFSTAISVTSGNQTDYYFEFNNVSVSNVVFSVTATITSGDTMKVGQIYCGSQIFEMGPSSGDLIVKPLIYQKTIQMSDGTQQKIYHRRVINYSLRLVCIALSDKLNYRYLMVCNRRETFVFVPEPATGSDLWDGQWGHYNVSDNADIENYTDGIQDNGYNIVFDLIQAGGYG